MHRRTVMLGAAILPLMGRQAIAGSIGGMDEGIVTEWATANRFAGVVAFGRRGKPTWSRAFGPAVVEDRVAATPGTRYAIGSVSKWFTTTAVLRLCDRGMLRLDAPIATYLPSIAGDAGERVLLVHLLSNASGIPDRLAAALGAEPAIRTSTASAAQMAARFAPGELAFEPGTKFDYTVLNWVIVRALLERVTGRSFGTLMRDLVLRPAGVEGVGIAETGFVGVAGLAPAYAGPATTVRKVSSVGAFAAASGTFYANAGELIAAAHRIFGSGLLSDASRRAMLTVRIPEQDYAIGGRVHVVDGRTWAWEMGKIGGYRTHLAHDVAADRSIVVLGNTDMEQATISALVDRLIGSGGDAGDARLRSTAGAR